MKILSSVFIALNLITPINSFNKLSILLANDGVSSSSIAETNVNYDLRYFFGGDDYRNYDIYNHDLIPNENDPYKDFKFLLAKPCDNDLYLYFYYNNSKLVTNVTFKISQSVEKNEDGSYKENFQDYTASVVNSYGVIEKFYKVKIDDFANYTDGSRIYIKNCNLNYSSVIKSQDYIIEDELIFNLSDTGDVIYSYFKNDYVLIKDHVMGLLLSFKDIPNPYNGDDALVLNGDSSNGSVSFAEDFYYFFSTDRKMDDLLEIQYDYTLCSFTEKHQSGKYYLSDLGAFSYSVTPYKGLSNGKKVDENSKAYTTYSNKVVSKGTSVGTVTRPYFLFWNKKVSYNLENIQNCKDTSNLIGDENKGFKEFIEDTQKANNNKFDWAFRVHSDTRNVVGTKKTFILWTDHFTTSYCHDVLQTIIVRLKFRENLEVKDMLVVDTPIDTSYSYVNHVEYDDLFDDIGEIPDRIKDSIDDLSLVFKILFGILLFLFIFTFVRYVYSFIKENKNQKKNGYKKKGDKNENNKKR